MKPRALAGALVAAAALLLSACAHQITIGPDIAKIEREPGSPRIARRVAYLVDPDLHGREVITPGGGGDRVSYKPYQDLETGIYKMLTNVFSDVSLRHSRNETAAVGSAPVDFVINTELLTNSSSDSAFTWPPTRFTVSLSCTVSDPAGATVAKLTVVGEGHAEFSEFRMDFGLAARRASEDALLKMQDRLLQQKELQAP